MADISRLNLQNGDELNFNQSGENLIPTIPTMGDVDNLTTTAKDTLVNAINENKSNIDTANTNISNRALTTETGYSITLVLNNTNFQLYAQLKNKAGTVISTSSTIDLPIESTIVDGRYDSATKSFILILQNGNTITVPLTDIISGLVDEETFNNAIEEVNTTIENLEAKIEDEQSLQDSEIENLKTLRNILPKVNGTGESITLDNTGETTFFEFNKFGKTYQYQTTGRNSLPAPTVATSETINGMTLSTDGKGSYRVSGTLASETNTNKLFSIPEITIPAGTYYWHLRNTGTTTTNVSFAIRQGNQSKGYSTPSVNNRIATLTLTEDTTFNSIQLFVSSNLGTSTAIDITFTPSIETGDSVTEFEEFTYGASPNPDFLQPIHSVSGDNTIMVTGKNLLNPQFFQQGSIDGTTGEDTSNSKNARGSNYIPVQPNTTYTISTNTPVFQLRLSEYGIDKTHIKRSASANSVSSFTTTTTSETYFVRWSLNYDNTTNTSQELIDSLDLQLEKGSLTAYEPFGDTYPLYLGATQLIDDTKKTSATNNIYMGVTNTTTTMPFKKGTYSIRTNVSCIIQVLKTSGDLSSPSSSTTFTFTLDSDEGIRIRLQKAGIVPSDVEYCIVTEGNVPSHITTQILELNAIGDYKDTFIYTDKWYLKQMIEVIEKNSGNYINKIGTNSDENFTQFNYLIYSDGHPVMNSNLTNDEIGRTSVFCNQLKPNSNAGNKPGIACIGLHIATRNIIIMVMPTSIAGTNEEINTYLQNNPMKFMYPINEKLIPVTDTTLISQLNAIKNAMSKKGQTNISQVNNDLPFELDVIALRDLSSVLDRLDLLEE